jgi:predicted aconitase
MQLTASEERSLNGEDGEAIASAYRILLAIGAATEAEKLVPIKWAHVSGVNYNTIGDSGVEFLEKFAADDARVAVKTTLNPMGFDRTKPNKLDENFVRQQLRIVKSFEGLGTTQSFTCVPYEIFDIPPAGTAVSFAESNAAIYSNSVLGLLTNKESSLSALASSMTGKAPYSDLRIEEFRHPKVTVRPDVELLTELDYGLLGYFTGKIVNDSCVALDGINEIKSDTIKTKCLSAALGTSGTCGMFISSPSEELGQKDKFTQEIVAFDKAELNAVNDELNTADDGNAIVLGSPQLGLNELNLIFELAKGKKFSKRCMIFCPRRIYNQASKTGLTSRIENTGAEFVCDSCACLTPLITKNDVDSIITNSIKAAYYLSHFNQMAVLLKDLKTIVKNYAN